MHGGALRRKGEKLGEGWGRDGAELSASSCSVLLPPHDTRTPPFTLTQPSPVPSVMCFQTRLLCPGDLMWHTLTSHRPAYRSHAVGAYHRWETVSLRLRSPSPTRKGTRAHRGKCIRLPKRNYTASMSNNGAMCACTVEAEASPGSTS